MVKVFFFQTQFRISWKDFGSLEMSNDANLKKQIKRGLYFMKILGGTVAYSGGLWSLAPL